MSSAERGRGRAARRCWSGGRAVGFGDEGADGGEIGVGIGGDVAWVERDEDVGFDAGVGRRSARGAGEVADLRQVDLQAASGQAEEEVGPAVDAAKVAAGGPADEGGDAEAFARLGELEGGAAVGGVDEDKDAGPATRGDGGDGVEGAGASAARVAEAEEPGGAAEGEQAGAVGEIGGAGEVGGAIAEGIVPGVEGGVEVVGRTGVAHEAFEGGTSRRGVDEVGEDLFADVGAALVAAEIDDEVLGAALVERSEDVVDEPAPIPAGLVRDPGSHGEVGGAVVPERERPQRSVGRRLGCGGGGEGGPLRLGEAAEGGGAFVVVGGIGRPEADDERAVGRREKQREEQVEGLESLPAREVQLGDSLGVVVSVGPCERQQGAEDVGGGNAVNAEHLAARRDAGRIGGDFGLSGDDDAPVDPAEEQRQSGSAGGEVVQGSAGLVGGVEEGVAAADGGGEAREFEEGLGAGTVGGEDGPRRVEAGVEIAGREVAVEARVDGFERAAEQVEIRLKGRGADAGWLGGGGGAGGRRRRGGQRPGRGERGQGQEGNAYGLWDHGRSVAGNQPSRL